MKTLMLGGWAVALLLGAVPQAKDKKPKPKTIKQIMEETHKGADNPASEVRHGRGTPEMAKTLLEAYKLMASMKPPRGDEKSWKSRTEAVIAALTDLLANKSGAVDRVYSATDCRACHDPHRVGGNK